MKKLILLILTTFVFSACQNKDKNAEVLAKVDGVEITYGDLIKKYPELQKQILKLEENIFRYKRAYAERMTDDKVLELEATKQGTTVQGLLNKNVLSKISAVSDADVDKFAKDRKLTKEQTEKLRDRIKIFLQRQKENDLRSAYVSSIKKNHDVKILLKRPDKPKVNVKVSDADPSIGPKSAKVTMVVFSDFQCPFCARASEPFRKILAEYKDRVHFVWKNFPLSFHNRARAASLAAMCANEQGKFWEYHDTLFDNRNALSDADFIKYAKKVGVKDIKAFENCYKSKKYDAKINKDIAEGSSYGVTGTPSFFVNGEAYVGALPYQKLKEAVEDALKN